MGKLRRLDDLFDLPETLNIYNNLEYVQNALVRTRSLLRALHKVFGVEFYAIGILRFVSDMSGFAGPLLLAALLNHKNGGNTGTDLEAYGYALGLFGVTLIGKYLKAPEKSNKKFMKNLFHRRCLLRNAFQLANVIDQLENANRHHNGYLSKNAGSAVHQWRQSRSVEFDVDRYRSNSEFMHQFSFILEHSVSG